MTSDMKRFLLTFIPLLASLQLLAAGISGSWKTHPTLERQIASMAASPERLYILMHQQEYRNNVADDTGTPAARVFYIDNGSDRICQLSELAPLSGTAVRTMRYNPQARCLFVGYDEGGIDLIYDDGRCLTVPDLALLRRPGNKRMREVTFSPDGTMAVVATDFGMMTVDCRSGQATVIDLRTPLSIAAYTGSRTLAVTPEGVLIEADGIPVSSSSFSIMSADSDSAPEVTDTGGRAISPVAIMPLSADAFAFLTAVGNDRWLALAVRRGAKWHNILLEKDGFRLLEPNNYLNVRVDINAYPDRDGFYLHANNIAYQLCRDTDFSLPDDQLKEAVMKVRYKVDDGRKESASWDFDNYWFFNEREGFYSRSVSEGYLGATRWLSPSPLVASGFPIAGIANNIVWHPRRGLLVQNHGIDHNFTSQRVTVPWLLCGYKDGVWTNYSPSYHFPDFTADDPALLAAYRDSRQFYPLTGPSGIEIDPDNPELIYTGSQTGGMARINLAHLSAPVLHMSQGADRAKGFPGHVAIAPTQQAWDQHCSFSTPRADKWGNLWSIYYDLDAQESGSNEASVWVWPAENRKASAEAHINTGSFRPWHVVKYDDFKSSNYQMLLPLKASVNSSLILLTANDYASPLLVVDHRGTVTDTSDDRIVRLGQLTDVNGSIVGKSHIFDMKEDPETGMVWVCTNSGVFYFSPATAFLHDEIVVQPAPFDPDRKGEHTLLAGVQANSIAFDAQGRKWIGTHGEGLVCLSADNKEILGRWTTRNSPLPSDRIYAVGCDMEMGNVLVSTELGLMEFIPDGTNARRAASAAPVVSPARVEPDYHGWISVRGLPEASAYSICDSEGKTIARVAMRPDGSLRWDGLSADGTRVASGRYFVTEANGNRLAEIIMLR